MRRSSICGQVSVITFSSRSLNTSQRKLTKPRSGLLCEARAESTLPRTVRLSPGRTGLSQRTSSMPGAPIEAASSSSPSAIIFIITQQVCQPDAPSPPSMVPRAASSSRCIGCGSNCAANPIISSRVTRRGPYSAVQPGEKSSK